MGKTIQAESHTLELPKILLMERDSDIIEFYDQPTSLKLTYKTVNERRVGYLHVPDFFEISKKKIGFIECKPTSVLEKLSKERPNFFQRSPEGMWICPPGIQAAQEFGLSYEIFTDQDISWTRIEDLQILEEYYDVECPAVSPDKVASIDKILKEEKKLSIQDLIEKHRIDPDVIYKLIVDGHIYFDMEKTRISDKPEANVFLNETYAEAYRYQSASHTKRLYHDPGISVLPGTEVEWDGKNWRILNAGQTKILLEPLDGDPIPLSFTAFEDLVRKGEIAAVATSKPVEANNRFDAFANARDVDLEKANHRARIIAPILEGIVTVDEVTEAPKRSVLRWISSYRKAEREYGLGYIGLIPRTSRQGNSSPRLSDETIKIMSQIVENSYETPKQKTFEQVYRELDLECRSRGIPTPSRKALRKIINSRHKEDQTASRKGKRAAYAHVKLYWRLDQTLPPQGTRAFEIAHIDHTQLDLECLDSDLVTNLGRPWLTLMMDANTRRILAFSITYDPPSYSSCMMVIRDCVRRNQRLPQIIVVDNGKEFDSIAFESLLACYGVTKKSRPPAKSRFGNVIERFFGTTNTQLLYSLAGNTQITKEVRIMTKSVDPKNLAVWTLPKMYLMMEDFFFEIYDQQEHPALNRSPRVAYAQSVEYFGERKHKLIAYSEEFFIRTLPSTQKGTAKVNYTRGIQVMTIRYWNDCFRAPGVAGSSVPVKYDPENTGVVYAFVQGRWVQCISEYYSILKGKSWRQIAVASAELRKKNRDHPKKKRITVYKLAMFLKSVESEEALLRQQKKDNEMKMITQGMNHLSLVDDSQDSRHTDRDETLDQIITEGEADIPSFEAF